MKVAYCPVDGLEWTVGELDQLPPAPASDTPPGWSAMDVGRQEPTGDRGLVAHPVPLPA